MNIFLGNAPWDKPGFYGVRAGSRWPHFEKDTSGYMPFPFFLAYGAALLRENGFTVTIVDAIAEHIDADEFFARMRAFKPDMVFLEVSSSSLSTDLEVLHRTRRELGDQPRVAFGGLHREMAEPEFLAGLPELDFCLLGEYETTLLALAKALREGAPVEGLPALASRKADGTISVNASYNLLEDLDSMPWPARDLLPMERYRDLPGGIPAPSLQLIASRGCPFGCIYCAWPQLMYGSNRYRTRNPKDVVDEIEDCVRTFGFKSFYFDDDTFNIGKPRILALAAEIRDRKLNLPWAIMARADTMDREMLVALKEAGLVALKYGVESGSQDLLKHVSKGLDLGKVRETVAITRELGIAYHLTFMFGLPGETMETADKTIALALELDPDTVQFSIATPFPGSQFHRELLAKGHLVSTNYDEYDGYHNAVVRTETLLPPDLIALRQKAELAWRAHCQKRQAAKA